jgi:hypothetical protein
MDLGATGAVMETNVEAANSISYSHTLGGIFRHGLGRLLGLA